jgi:hypothetical protein
VSPDAAIADAPIADATRASALPVAATWDHRRTTAGHATGRAVHYGEGAT